MVAKTLSRALALLLLSIPAAFGLGLGDIRLQSALNAPLDAEIELVGATPEELAGLKAQVASRDTFARYGLDYPAFISSITVRAEHSADGRDVIKLHSREAITEPFVTVLLEVNWARGKLIREYTMLLDPPVYTPGQQAGSQAPVAAPLSGDTSRSGEISRAPQASSDEGSATQQQPSTSSSSSSSYTPSAAAGAGSTRVVRRGDTLSRIASEVTGGDTRSSRKWMVAIYRGNPRAFDGNMNILRSGAELQIPENAAVDGISSGEANSEIRQQYASWHGASAPSTGEPASDQGHLKLIPTPAPAATTPGTDTSTAAASGNSTALQGRVRELEAQLQESRRLIEMKDAELARMQAAAGAKQGQTPPSQEAPPAAATPPAAETPPAAPEEAPPSEEPPSVEPTPEPAAQAPAATEPTKPSLMDKLKDYWWVAAALLLVILGLFGVRAWRAKQQNDFDDSLGRLADSDRDFNTSDTTPVRAIGPEPSFLVEESGTHERPRFATPAAAPPPNVATEDTISSETAINLDQGDPLAEADFHMAYGLYDQAADLVRIAISREPERRDLKLKLLEVFFVWGNKEQFLQTAHELAATREQAAPGEWEKIVIMGKQLAPEDELFSSGGIGGAAAGGVDLDLEGGQSRVDFDLLGEPVADGDQGGVDLDIGSALADRDATAESPTRTTDAHLALHDSDSETTATTREITREMPSTDEPAPVMPEYNLEGPEAEPTVEQPAVTGDPTIRQKVDMALKQGGGADQTAELAIDDLGLDLTALDTVDQPGLGQSGDAPTLVAGLDERSRQVMADAEDSAGNSATAAWRVRPEDLDPTLPPTRVEALEGDISATSRMSTISEQDIDFDFDAEENVASNGAVDLDVGTATVPDMSHAATQRIAAEDLALPDLEPVTMSEVGTKLDLARAYMDMGDPEGARNILEEVLQEGSVTQKQEAQRLIDSLPG